MRNTIGAAVGAVALGVAIIIATTMHGVAWTGNSNQGALRSESATNSTPVRTVDVRPLALNEAQGAAISSGGSVLVNCAPGQQTLVRQRKLNGETVASVECVGEATTEPVYVTRGVSDSRVITTSARAPRSTRVVSRESRPRRSTKKTVLFIGGSTATGAGIGGLIGGKKGALIGAAIGGGTSSIYEAGKSR